RGRNYDPGEPRHRSGWNHEGPLRPRWDRGSTSHEEGRTMKGIVSLEQYRSMFPTIRAKQLERVIHKPQLLRAIKSRYYQDHPIRFHIGGAKFAGEYRYVIKNPFNGVWHPWITRDGVPLLIHDLIDR